MNLLVTVEEKLKRWLVNLASQILVGRALIHPLAGSHVKATRSAYCALLAFIGATCWIKIHSAHCQHLLLRKDLRSLQVELF